jgi:nitroreductase
MNPGTGAQLVGQLEWRYAVKSFDPAREIDAETWASLEQSLVLTPSSFGLQPWKFLVLRDRPLRERLLPHSWGQKQVIECSHYVVFAIVREVGEAHIDKYLERIAEVRSTPLEKLAGFRKMMVGNLVTGSFRPMITEWATRQAYIALGNFMTAAAMIGVDTCPMEGFEPAKYDEILGLPARGLASVVACAAGYRHPADKYASVPKVRFPAGDVIEHL